MFLVRYVLCPVILLFVAQFVHVKANNASGEAAGGIVSFIIAILILAFIYYRCKRGCCRKTVVKQYVAAPAQTAATSNVINVTMPHAPMPGSYYPPAPMQSPYSPPGTAPNYPTATAPSYPPGTAPYYPPGTAPNYPPSTAPNYPTATAPSYPLGTAPNYPPGTAPYSPPKASAPYQPPLESPPKYSN